VDALSRDEAYMQRALDLAAEGLGRVEPNPMVGAVVVQGERVVGEGYHARFGGPHAEVVALDQAADGARGGELFVTLEPCCHHGKTPPCTDAVLAAGIRRVVAAIVDPFPEMAGRGLAILEEAGVEVRVGVLEEPARRLNAAYLKRQKTGLPLVIAKWAMTLDGRLATSSGDSRWISSKASRRRVHELRRVSDAVLVGSGTALVDEPSLTVRHVEPYPERGQPTRVILDTHLVLDPMRQPARSAGRVPVIVYTSEAALAEDGEAVEALRGTGCEIVTVPPAPAGLSLPAVLVDLGKREMSRVLVEGGSRILGSFFAAGLVDRVMVFVSPRILGSADALGPVAGPYGRELVQALEVADLAVETVGPDRMIEGRVSEF